MKKILAIESSCDETSASVVTQENSSVTIHSNITATSLDLHATTGGIIPENAARMQVRYILPVIWKALLQSEGIEDEDNIDRAREILSNDINAIAVTYGPGLIGSLLVGVETAKTLSYVFKKELIQVNHLLAHIYANFIDRNSIQFPFIGLIVSGGHTDLLLFNSHTNYQWLGGTRDDAAGEAFDKTGRLLDLAYPAGPEIERRASLVKNSTIKFKSPIMHEDNFDFSFSGLKTEVQRFTQQHNVIDTNLKNQICCATQKAILDVLIKKTLNASQKYNAKIILVGGGVSANQTFRELLSNSADLPVLFPEKKYSTDNAAMIGAYASIQPTPIAWNKTTANPELYFA
jgi:N6-L-threonylcarbamoyladenine synthase